MKSYSKRTIRADKHHPKITTTQKTTTARKRKQRKYKYNLFKTAKHNEKLPFRILTECNRFNLQNTISKSTAKPSEARFHRPRPSSCQNNLSNQPKTTKKLFSRPWTQKAENRQKRASSTGLKSSGANLRQNLHQRDLSQAYTYENGTYGWIQSARANNTNSEGTLFFRKEGGKSRQRRPPVSGTQSKKAQNQQDFESTKYGYLRKTMGSSTGFKARVDVMYSDPYQDEPRSRPKTRGILKNRKSADYRNQWISTQADQRRSFKQATEGTEGVKNTLGSARSKQRLGSGVSFQNENPAVTTLQNSPTKQMATEMQSLSHRNSPSRHQNTKNRRIVPFRSFRSTGKHIDLQYYKTLKKQYKQRCEADYEGIVGSLDLKIQKRPEEFPDLILGSEDMTQSPKTLCLSLNPQLKSHQAALGSGKQSNVVVVQGRDFAKYWEKVKDEALEDDSLSEKSITKLYNKTCKRFKRQKNPKNGEKFFEGNLNKNGNKHSKFSFKTRGGANRDPNQPTKSRFSYNPLQNSEAKKSGNLNTTLAERGLPTPTAVKLNTKFVSEPTILKSRRQKRLEKITKNTQKRDTISNKTHKNQSKASKNTKFRTLKISDLGSPVKSIKKFKSFNNLNVTLISVKREVSTPAFQKKAWKANAKGSKKTHEIVHYFIEEIEKRVEEPPQAPNQAENDGFLMRSRISSVEELTESSMASQNKQKSDSVATIFSGFDGDETLKDDLVGGKMKARGLDTPGLDSSQNRTGQMGAGNQRRLKASLNSSRDSSRYLMNTPRDGGQNGVDLSGRDPKLIQQQSGGGTKRNRDSSMLQKSSFAKKISNLRLNLDFANSKRRRTGFDSPSSFNRNKQEFGIDNQVFTPRTSFAQNPRRTNLKSELSNEIAQNVSPKKAPAVRIEKKVIEVVENAESKNSPSDRTKAKNQQEELQKKAKEHRISYYIYGKGEKQLKTEESESGTDSANRRVKTRDFLVLTREVCSKLSQAIYHLYRNLGSNYKLVSSYLLNAVRKISSNPELITQILLGERNLAVEITFLTPTYFFESLFLGTTLNKDYKNWADEELELEKRMKIKLACDFYYAKSLEFAKRKAMKARSHTIGFIGSPGTKKRKTTAFLSLLGKKEDGAGNGPKSGKIRARKTMAAETGLGAVESLSGVLRRGGSQVLNTSIDLQLKNRVKRILEAGVDLGNLETDPSAGRLNTVSSNTEDMVGGVLGKIEEEETEKKPEIENLGNGENDSPMPPQLHLLKRAISEQQIHPGKATPDILGAFSKPQPKKRKSKISASKGRRRSSRLSKAPKKRLSIIKQAKEPKKRQVKTEKTKLNLSKFSNLSQYMSYLRDNEAIPELKTKPSLQNKRKFVDKQKKYKITKNENATQHEKRVKGYFEKAMDHTGSIRQKFSFNSNFLHQNDWMNWDLDMFDFVLFEEYKMLQERIDSYVKRNRYRNFVKAKTNVIENFKSMEKIRVAMERKMVPYGIRELVLLKNDQSKKMSVNNFDDFRAHEVDIQDIAVKNRLNTDNLKFFSSHEHMLNRNFRKIVRVMNSKAEGYVNQMEIKMKN